MQKGHLHYTLDNIFSLDNCQGQNIILLTDRENINKQISKENINRTIILRTVSLPEMHFGTIYKVVMQIIINYPIFGLMNHVAF